MSEWISRDNLLAFVKMDAELIAPEKQRAEDILMMIKVAPAVTLEPTWISVKDRLPEDERPVLTFMGYDDQPRIGFQQIQYYCCFDPSPHWQYAGLLRDGQAITHWMPLPEPPEDGGADHA